VRLHFGARVGKKRIQNWLKNQPRQMSLEAKIGRAGQKPYLNCVKQLDVAAERSVADGTMDRCIAKRSPRPQDKGITFRCHILGKQPKLKDKSDRKYIDFPAIMRHKETLSLFTTVLFSRAYIDPIAGIMHKPEISKSAQHESVWLTPNGLRGFLQYTEVLRSIRLTT